MRGVLKFLLCRWPRFTRGVLSNSAYTVATIHERLQGLRSPTHDGQPCISDPASEAFAEVVHHLLIVAIPPLRGNLGTMKIYITTKKSYTILRVFLKVV